MDSADPLSELADIHLPEEVGLWPLAPGWWVLLALVAAGLIWLAIILFRRWRTQRYCRFALAELEKCYRQHENAAADDARELDLINGVNAVLRRVALRHYPQEPVAGLTGRAWVDFLRSHGDASRLDDELGSALAHGRFAPRFRIDSAKLHAMAEQWIKSQYLARIDSKPSPTAAPEHA